MKFTAEIEDFLCYMEVLVELLSLLENEFVDYKEIISEKAEKLKPYITKSFGLIAEYYSIPPEIANEEFRKLLEENPPQSPEEVRQFVSGWNADEFVASLFQNDDEEKQFLEEMLPHFIASARVFTMNMQSGIKYKRTVNQLIQEAFNGDDESLFLAIYVDPLVENIPEVSERISYAETIGDKKFLEQLNKSRTANREDNRQRDKRLAFFLNLFSRFGLLDSFSQPQLAHIFINRLGVYDKEEEALYKYIGRWKKSLKVFQQRQNNKYQKSKT